MSHDALYVCAASWYKHFTALLSPVRMAFSQWSNWFSYKSWSRSRGTCKSGGNRFQMSLTKVQEEWSNTMQTGTILCRKTRACVTNSKPFLAGNQTGTCRLCCLSVQAAGFMQFILAIVQAWSYLFIFIVKRAPHLKAGVLVGIMYVNVVAIPSDVHCTEKFRAMKQQGVTKTAY